MATRHASVLHLVIPQATNGEARFFVYPHPNWHDNGTAYLALPSKKLFVEPVDVEHDGTSLEHFVDQIEQGDLRLSPDDYTIESELGPDRTACYSPTAERESEYTIYPVGVWVRPELHDQLADRLNGQWLTLEEAIEHPAISPTAQTVLHSILHKQSGFDGPAAPANGGQKPKPKPVGTHAKPNGASMNALALRWLARNRSGVRILKKETLNEILDAGDRAFNLRVADPYLMYQLQGFGFTWAFFTDKDRQDLHMHPEPIYEIYGILEGHLEAWWKSRNDRGVAAWHRRILGPGDWMEVGPLQCHMVHWLTEGKGVVFKAGPGQLAGVGRLGEKGKTCCTDCGCQKPPRVYELEIHYKDRTGPRPENPIPAGAANKAVEQVSV